MPTYGWYQAPHERHEYPSGLGYVPDGEQDWFSSGVRNKRTSLIDNRPLYGPHMVPINEYQALMECDFNEHPAMTEQEREADWLLFEEKISLAQLTDRERVVVDCIVFGNLSLTQTADYLARHESKNKPYHKQTIHNIRNVAFAKLRVVFGQQFGDATDDHDDGVVEWDAYWDSLTDDEKARERQMMDYHNSQKEVSE